MSERAAPYHVNSTKPAVKRAWEDCRLGWLLHSPPTIT